MTLRRPPGRVTALLLSCHPLPAAAMTVGLTTAAALTGRSRVECLLVGTTVLTGQLTIGWTNDLVDAERDRRTGRRDKPVALGWVEPRTVRAATAGMALLVVPLSLANGTPAGAAHLAFVLSGWGYNVHLKATLLSWLPYVVGFGALPAFLSYGGLGPGRHGAAPTTTMTVGAGLLGIGIHVLNTLPDLDEDEEMGVRHLPLVVARLVGTRRLAWLSGAATAAVAAAMTFSARTAGLRR